MLAAELTAAVVYLVRYGHGTYWTYERHPADGEPDFAALVVALPVGFIVFPVFGWLLLNRSGVGSVAKLQLQAFPALLFLFYIPALLLDAPGGGPMFLFFLCAMAALCYATAAMATDHDVPLSGRLCATGLLLTSAALAFAGCAVV